MAAVSSGVSASTSTLWLTPVGLVQFTAQTRSGMGEEVHIRYLFAVRSNG